MTTSPIRIRHLASAASLAGASALLFAIGTASCSSSGTPGTGGAGGAGGAATGPTQIVGPQNVASCQQAGQYALFVDLKVNWPANQVIAAGTGDLKEWWSVARLKTTTGVSDTLNLCGLDFPDLPANAPLSGVWGVRFPSMTFDNSEITPIVTQGTLDAPAGGMLGYHSSVFAQTFGVQIADPVNTPWPAMASALTPQDTDNDGKPGVSVEPATGGSYVNFSAGLTGPAADRLYIAARQVMSLSGTTNDCSRYSGTTTVATIGSAPSINIHVLGCRHAGQPDDCTPQEATFVDGVVPALQPGPSSTFQMVKLNKVPTCAEVRTIVGVQ